VRDWHDGALEVADVEAALDELLGEPREELGVGGRIAGADVVERIDEADAEKVAPHAVDVAEGEVAVVGGGHPGGQRLAASRADFRISDFRFFRNRTERRAPRI
jgi:hypothetical protein